MKKITRWHQLLPFIFRVLLVWYVTIMLLEFIFPGFASNRFDLNRLLWVVVLFGGAYAADMYRCAQQKKATY